MKTEQPTRGQPYKLRCETPEGQSLGGKRGGAQTLAENERRALWDEIIAMNRASGPWGALAMWRNA